MTEVAVNIRRSKDVPARQRAAWDEFLDMVVERAGALRDKEAGESPSRQKEERCTRQS